MLRTLLVAAAMLLVGMAGCTSNDTTPDEVADDLSIEQQHLQKVGSPPGPYDFSGPYSVPLTQGTHEILPAEAVRIPSALDGADIHMGLHLPDGEGPFPVLVFASPYFGFLGGNNDVTDRLGGFGNLVESFVPHGYAVVGLAIRGTGDSGGCNDLMGPQETADLDQAITWLGEQDWSNGAVAMTGVSYDGSTPWGVAATGNPYLKTIIPISGVPDMYGLMYRNGSSETRGPLVLNALYYGGNIIAGTASPEHKATRVVCPEALAGTGISGATAFTGEDPTGFWQERDRKPHVEEKYTGSVFSVQGLQDWNVDPSQVIPWVDQLDQQGIKTKQLLGQWGHNWPDRVGSDPDPEDWLAMRADYQEILLRWLDSELKGKDVDTGPAVQVRDDLGRWRNEDHYPPRDTQWTTLALTADGQLAAEPGPAGGVLLRPNLPFFTEQFVPGSIDSPIENYVDFETPVFEEETLVVGLPKPHVTVVPHAPGGYLGAYLYERDPSGEDRLLGWTSMNLAFADGGQERTEVVPGEPLEVKMEIQPMDGVVRAGNQLALRVWVFTDGDRLPTLPPGSVELLVGEGSGSVFRLPTVERTEEDYFVPPVPRTVSLD